MKTIIQKLMCMVSLMVAVVYAAPAGAVICSSIADVYIDSAAPDENFNDKTRILIAYHPGKGIARGLVKFDIPEEIDAFRITAATLHLSSSYHTGGGNAISVRCYALNAPFREESDTWNTLDGGDFDSSVSSPGKLPSGNDWETSIDLTALAIQNLEKLRTNGMLIRLQTEGPVREYQNIASRECVDPEDFAPYLDIVLDSDHDGVADSQDNCPLKPNGPLLGSCSAGPSVGALCTVGGANPTECGAGGFCSMNQEDSFPPGGNACGDACECEGNFDGDLDVDGKDAGTFKKDYGRGKIRHSCTRMDPCNGDFDCDNDVDGINAIQFKRDFGRGKISNPCPSCPTDTWCVY